MSLTIKHAFSDYLNFLRKVNNLLDINTIKNALALLRKTSLDLSNRNKLVVAIFFSKVIKIPEVKDISFSMNDRTLVLFAYINEPNWEAEDRIYEAYSLLLELFPDLDIDLKVFELYGRTVEELELCKF